MRNWPVRTFFLFFVFSFVFVLFLYLYKGNFVTNQNCISDRSGFVAESTTTFTERANEFRMKGVFDREIGDLVMKVCCNVLKVSIITITSSRSTPVVPFVPDSPLSTTPIHIALHYYQICTSGM